MCYFPSSRTFLLIHQLLDFCYSHPIDMAWSFGRVISMCQIESDFLSCISSACKNFFFFFLLLKFLLSFNISFEISCSCEISVYNNMHYLFWMTVRINIISSDGISFKEPMKLVNFCEHIRLYPLIAIRDISQQLIH